MQARRAAAGELGARGRLGAASGGGGVAAGRAGGEKEQAARVFLGPARLGFRVRHFAEGPGSEPLAKRICRGPLVRPSAKSPFAESQAKPSANNFCFFLFFESSFFVVVKYII